MEFANADDEQDAETWEEAMDEMEDPWMRDPSGRLDIVCDFTTGWQSDIKNDAACMFAGKSFAELGENTIAPAIETARKVSLMCAVTLCEPSYPQTGMQLVLVPCRLCQSSLLTSFKQ